MDYYLIKQVLRKRALVYLATVLFLIAICSCDSSEKSPSGALGSSVPSNPKTLTITQASEASLTLEWVSSEEVVLYKMAYTVGSIAPATCQESTMIDTSAITGTSHSISGLLASTEYSFRVCAVSITNPSLVSVGITTSGQTNTADAISISNVSVTAVQVDGFTVSADYSGDGNSNATVNLYYCNETDSPSCDPSVGTANAMSKGVGLFTATIGALTDPDDSGDTFNLLIVADDVDNSSAATLTGSVTTASALFATGLVARYYIDEASTGQIPTELVDSAASPLNLPLSYAVNTMNFIELTTGRGLNWTTNADSSQACIDASGTKFASTIGGSNTGTLEVVSEVISASSSASRLLHFGYSSTSTFTLEYDGTKVIFDHYGVWSIQSTIDLSPLERITLTAVFDSNQATDSERAKIYINGVEQTIDSGATWPSLGFGLVLSNPNTYFCIGNRAIGDRSIEGSIYYGAIYDTALPADKILRNSNILLTNDDTP